MGLVGTIMLAVLVLAGAPAAAQTPTTTAAPEVEAVDVEDFEDRAQRWAEARRRAREEALRKAEELAIDPDRHAHIQNDGFTAVRHVRHIGYLAPV